VPPKKKDAEQLTQRLNDRGFALPWPYEVSWRAWTGSVLRNTNRHYDSPRIPLGGTLDPPR